MTLILVNVTVVLQDSHEKNNIGNYIAEGKLLLTSASLMKTVKYKIIQYTIYSYSVIIMRLNIFIVKSLKTCDTPS